MLILTFHNDLSGTETAANYNVAVRVNDRVIHTARVEGHNRADGWHRLVEQWLAEDLPKRVGSWTGTSSR